MSAYPRLLAEGRSLGLLCRLALAVLVCLLVASPRALADVEPNDLLPQSEVVPSAPFATSGTFGTDNDIDYYAVYVGTPSTQLSAHLRATTSSCNGSSSCFATVAIGHQEDSSFDYDSSDADRASPEDADPNLDVAVTFSAPDAGTYYVRVESARNRPSGYTLTIDANQPLLTYKPETCAAARAEFEARQTDLANASDAAANAEAKVAKLAAARGAKRRTITAAKRRRSATRGARRARSVRKLRTARKRYAALTAALAEAENEYEANLQLIPFQQGRVSEQEAATRSACGGSV